jgi:hypothetical protein
MSFYSARQNFENARATGDQAIQQLAEGLIQLTKGIEDDLNKLHRKIEDVERRVR